MPKVRPIACIAIPGNCASKRTVIPPKNNPWHAAYMGAVVAAMVGLKIVTRASIAPIPIPENIKTGLGRFQLIAAVAKHKEKNARLIDGTIQSHFSR